MTPPADTHVPDARGTNGPAASNGNHPVPPEGRPRVAEMRADRHELGSSQDDSCCSPSGARGAAGEDRIGAGWLVFLLMPLCCGGPLLVGAIAAAGAAAWGVLGGVVAIVVAGTLVVVVRRRTRRRRRPIEGRQAASQSRRQPLGGALR